MVPGAVGRIIGGRPTPLPLVAACVVGAIIGLLPGPTQAPGTVLLLLAIFTVLNASLWVAAATAVVTC